MSAPQTSHPQLCVICLQRPAYSGGGRSYPTCGLTCAAALQAARDGQASAPTSPPRRPRANGPTPPAFPQRLSKFHTAHHSNAQVGNSRNTSRNPKLCVICRTRPCPQGSYVTCSGKCTQKLCLAGGDPNMCNYCHQQPRLAPHLQCGKTCGEKAKAACLLCRSRPKNGRYHLCGDTCKQIAVKEAPLILEAHAGHSTFEMVEKKFQSSWKASSPCPKIQKVYKIVENANFLQAYDTYRQNHGNELFRYHGTSRQCSLGSQGQIKLCNSTSCAACSILRTSFKVSLANRSGAFGPGVYSSSASNKAFSYCGGTGGGIMFLTKVVLGKVRNVTNFGEVTSCPPGFDSVVYDRQNGELNETIVYTDDAIRPVFLIVF